MKKCNNEIEKDFDILTKFALPAFTILAYSLIAIEKPEYGVIASLIAQPFWLYSSWKAYRKVGQSGMFWTSVIITIILIVGVFNYWVK